MASESFAYDHPEYNVTRAAMFNAPATTAGQVVLNSKFKVFGSTRIKAIGAVIAIAGTNDAAGYDLYNGTTSIGAITTGTATAGSVITKVEIAAATAGTCTDTFEIRTKTNSATLSANITIEYELLAGATVTK